MDIDKLPPDLKQAVEFHGHLCPGLVIGYLAARAAAGALDLKRSADEELVAVVENDSCSVDAFQSLLSTTFGKGNLKWLDHGKQVFTLIDRQSNRAVRAAFIGDHLRRQKPDGSVDRAAFMRDMLAAPQDQVISLRQVEVPPPEPARIEPSLICQACGEAVQASRSVTLANGRILCRPCAQGVAS